MKAGVDLELLKEGTRTLNFSTHANLLAKILLWLMFFMRQKYVTDDEIVTINIQLK